MRGRRIVVSEYLIFWALFLGGSHALALMPHDNSIFSTYCAGNGMRDDGVLGVSVNANVSVNFNANANGSMGNESRPLSIPLIVNPAPGFIKNIVIQYAPTTIEPTTDSDVARRDIENSFAHKVGDDIEQLIGRNSLSRLVNDVKGFANQSLRLNSKKSPDEIGSLHFKIDGYARKLSFIYKDYFDTSLNFIGRDRQMQLMISKTFASNFNLSLKEQSPVSQWAVSSLVELGYRF